MNRIAKLIVLGWLSCLPGCMTAQKSVEHIMQSLSENLEMKDSTLLYKGLDDLYEAYFKENDPVYDVSQEITRRYRMDQGLRIMYINADKYKLNAGKKKMIHERMVQMDRENSVWCNQVLDKYGFPNYEDFGQEISDRFWNVIQHATDTLVLAKGIQLMKQQVDKQQATAWEYAFMIDRLALYTCRAQTYGTQHVNGYLVPVKDPEKVDSLRASVGLGPVVEDMRDENDSDFTWEKYHKTLEKNWASYRHWFSSRFK